MRLILMGAPGSGKGTEAKLLSERLNIPHISTGDILRRAMAEGQELGKTVRRYVEEGGLVPDEVMIEVIGVRIREDDCRRGFILDGFPRSLAQAESLQRTLNETNSALNLVVNLEASSQILIERLSGRRVCRRCQAVFHIKNLPPKKEGVCDHCGGKLYQRRDDKEEIVRRRIELYKVEAEKLLSYYRGERLLEAVNSEKGPQETLGEILVNLGAKV
ncbi:adenylate kinase [bacterium]|nr:adenylate kinase [bacterium]MCK4326771.1 adenylate kinase [bacterium]MCK4436840.1 adenylate kinase [bacterium]